MNRDPDTRQGTGPETDERDSGSPIVHETVPGEDPIVQGEDSEAKKKGSKSTADEDI